MRRLTLILAALALVLSACGDGDATDDTTTTTVAPGGDDTTTTMAEMPGTTSGDADGRIAALLEVFAETPLRLTYEFRGGEDGQDSIEVVLSQDPTADPQVSSIRSEGTLIISQGMETIFCDTAGGTCFQSPGQTASGLLTSLVGPVIGGFILGAGAEEIPGASIEEVEGVVAGRTGVCFEYTPPAEAESDTELVRQCIDAELGFTLLVQYQTAGGELQTVMELLDYSEPTAEDFEPTGPVTTP